MCDHIVGVDESGFCVKASTCGASVVRWFPYCPCCGMHLLPDNAPSPRATAELNNFSTFDLPRETSPRHDGEVARQEGARTETKGSQMKIECPECKGGDLTTEGASEFAYFRCPECGIEYNGVMVFPDDLEPVGRSGKTFGQIAVETGRDKLGVICPCGHYGTPGEPGVA